MTKRELVEKRLLDCLDAWVERFQMNLSNKDEWEKNHERAYKKIKEIIKAHLREQPNE